MALTPKIIVGAVELSTDQLDGWAEIFFEAKVAGLMRVPLSVFLSDPMRYIAEGDAPDRNAPSSEDDFLPLLPKQEEAAARIRAQWDREDALAAQKANHLTLVVSN